MKILVIGECGIDRYHYTKSNRLSPEAPVPVLNLVKTVDNYGMAGNVKRNLEVLGATVDLITNRCSTIIKTRFVDEHTNQMFIRFDENDVAEPMTRQEFDSIKWKDYDAVVVSDYNKGFLKTYQILNISMAHKLVFMDTKKILDDWADQVNFIKLNQHELNNSKLSGLTGKSREFILNNIIVTTGKGGCTYQNVTYPVDNVDVKDLSGAGDTFLAGLVVKYLECGDMPTSLIFANECATIVVQKRGVSTV